MKKILKYIGLIGLCSFILTSSAKAYSVSVGSGHLTDFGYSTQNQSIVGGKCDGVPVYCIEKGASNVPNFYGCEAIYVGNSAYAEVTKDFGDHDTREYLYRLIGENFGDAATYKNGRYINDYESLKNPYGWLPQHGLQSLADKLTGYLTKKTNVAISKSNFSYKVLNNDGNTATVVMELISSVPGLKFSTPGASIGTVDYADGKYTISATVPIIRCKGGNFKLVVNGDIDITVGTNEVYLFKCNNPYQSYIVPINKQGCSINELTNKGTTGNEYEVSVPDPICDCKGTTDMNGSCDKTGSVKDLEKEENLKSCIKQGGFAEYCQTNLEKKVDTHENTVGPILSKTNPSNTNVNLSSNKYCKVYCLEDIKFDLPGRIDTQNGSYFKLKKDWDRKTDSGTNMKITGTRTCYTSEIQKSEFIKDVKDLENQIKDSWNEYQKNKKIKEVIDNKDSYKKTDTKSCSVGSGTKSNNYTYYEADVKYDYEYGYPNGDGSWYTNVEKHDLKVKWGDNPTCNSDGSITEDTTEPTYVLDKNFETLLTQLSEVINNYKSCTEWTNNYCFNPKIEFTYDEVYKDVEGEVKKNISDLGKTTTYFTSVNDSYTNGSKSSGAKTSISYIYANDTSCNTQTSLIDLTTIYMKQEVKKEANYKDGVKEVYTYHPYGTIVTNKNSVDKKENLISLGYVFPVALQHDPDTGVYNYYLSISNIGVGGNDTSCEYKNKIIGADCSLFNTKNEVKAGREYVCQYKTKSCPNCEVECVCPDGSTNCYVENQVCKYKLCSDCIVECIGCIWNNGDATMAYKTISLDDVYVDDKQIGENWSEENIQEIQDKGQTIYENKPDFRIVMTQTLMSRIREYNDQNEEYSNDTLICSSNNSSNTYYCTSTFLRDTLSSYHANYTDFDRR